MRARGFQPGWRPGEAYTPDDRCGLTDGGGDRRASEKVAGMKAEVRRKLRRLANALSPEDLRDLAIKIGIPQAYIRQLPGLIDTLVADHHDALLDHIELRINEVAIEAADRSTHRRNN